MSSEKAVPLSLFSLESEQAQTAPEVPSRELAPMLQQYVELKKKFDSHILLFQVGDFYEIFFEDARTASDALNIRLTSRDKSSPNPIPMCGVPIHALDNYLPKLLIAGHSVAVVSQTDEKREKNQKGVKRELTRIITPGVRLEGDGLDDRSFNFCAAAIFLPEGGAVVAVDVSTGHMRIEESDSIERLIESLERLRVREILLPSTIEDRPIDRADSWYRDLRESANRAQIRISKRAFVLRPISELQRRVPITLERFSRATKLSLASLLNYADEISCGRLPPIGTVTVSQSDRTALIDAASCRNLELIETRIDGERKNSLLSHIDYTCTSMGARLIREWVTLPDATLFEVNQRHEAVAELLKDTDLLERIRILLREIRDLERCLSRIVSGRGVPRDLATLRDSIKTLPHLQLILNDFDAPLLKGIGTELPILGDLYEILTNALVSEPPLKINEGDIFIEGYNSELDLLRSAKKEGNLKLLEIEQRERARTGISSLKVRYNNVFGYSIEISKTHIAKVPSDYDRKQTLANVERYVTNELRQFEVDTLSAKERSFELEKELFLALREQVSTYSSLVQLSARLISTVDVLSSFAELAWRKNYVRPQMTQGQDLMIEEGRHPVVEIVIGQQNFVANNANLDGEDRRFAVLTGPNMGGKSTYLRQIGLIQLLAQAGSFVPAKKAVLGFVDRIFTRIGASDDLSRGDSTFMVEMRETSAILRRATSRSLVLIDEIGRGTATVDGRAIAFAVADYLHDRLRCRTIFATHFHELTSLRNKEGIFCLTVGVKEVGDEISFTHRILEEVGDRSYGLEVARLAGLPNEVLEMAKSYFSADSVIESVPTLKIEVSRTAKEEGVAISELKELNIDNLTPLDALLTLSRLKRQLGSGQ